MRTIYVNVILCVEITRSRANPTKICVKAKIDDHRCTLPNMIELLFNKGEWAKHFDFLI